MKKLIALLVAGHVASAMPAAATPTLPDLPAKRLSIARMALPGIGRGDYLTVDHGRQRLYVTHTAVVHVLDLATLKPLATLRGLSNAHGVAVDPASGRVFVSDGGRDAVVMFDPDTGTALASIDVGRKPDALLRDPASGKLLAFNGDGHSVSIIDPLKAALIDTIALPGSPEFAQADGKGTVWVNISDKSAIVAIDTRTMRIARTIPLTGCDDTTPLAFDPAARLLFAGCGNKVMKVVDADRGAIVATVPIAGDADGIAFDPVRQRLVVANREGAWTIVTQQARARYRVEPPLPIDVYAKTIAIDPDTHRLFSSTADFTWPRPTRGVRASPLPVPNTFRLIVVSER